MKIEREIWMTYSEGSFNMMKIISSTRSGLSSKFCVPRAVRACFLTSLPFCFCKSIEKKKEKKKFLYISWCLNNWRIAWIASTLFVIFKLEKVNAPSFLICLKKQHQINTNSFFPYDWLSNKTFTNAITTRWSFEKSCVPNALHAAALTFLNYKKWIIGNKLTKSKRWLIF